MFVRSRMASKIIILEDNAERTAAMGRLLADRFDQFDVAFYERAEAMVQALEAGWDQLTVIGLDHDLELIADSEGRWLDPGDGRQVVEFLVSRKPVCPVVIHSTNAAAALGME